MVTAFMIGFVPFVWLQIALTSSLHYSTGRPLAQRYRQNSPASSSLRLLTRSTRPARCHNASPRTCCTGTSCAARRVQRSTVRTWSQWRQCSRCRGAWRRDSPPRAPATPRMRERHSPVAAAVGDTHRQRCLSSHTQADRALIRALARVASRLEARRARVGAAHRAFIQKPYASFADSLIERFSPFETRAHDLRYHWLIDID